jgi:hypothetical protein
MKSATVTKQRGLGRVMPRSLWEEMQQALRTFAQSLNFQYSLPTVGRRHSLKPNLWHVELMVATVEPSSSGWLVTLWADALGYQSEAWRLHGSYTFKANEDRTYSIVGGL